ncbi:MAG: CvpA family protein [Bacteroidota bacterium]
MPIDIIFIAVLGLGFWQGYNRGIIRALFGLSVYLFGVVFAFKITPTTTNVLERLFNSENPVMFLAAFVVNLVLIMFIMRAAGRSITVLFEAAYLGIFNRALGGALMGGLAVLIYSVLLWFLVKVQFINDGTLSESRTYPLLQALPTRARTVAIRFKPIAEDMWGTSLDWMNRLEKFGIEKTKDGKPKLYDLPNDATPIEGAPDLKPAPRKPAAKEPEGNGIEQ